MLSSKLLLIVCTWGMAFLVSIFLRTAGNVHPQPFDINNLLVWIFVFAPSSFLLIYFLVKRSFSVDSSMWFWGSCDFKVFTFLFYFHFQSGRSRFIDFRLYHWDVVSLCTYFFRIDFLCFCCGMVYWIFCWKASRKIY